MATNDDSKNTKGYEFDQADFPTLGTDELSTKRNSSQQSAWAVTVPPKAVLSNSIAGKDQPRLISPLQSAPKSGRFVFKAFSYSDTQDNSSPKIQQPQRVHIAREDWRSAHRQTKATDTEGPWRPRYTPEQRESAWAKNGNWRARNDVGQRDGVTVPFHNIRNMPSSSHSSSNTNSFAKFSTSGNQTARDESQEEPKWKKSSDWRRKDSEI